MKRLHTLARLVSPRGWLYAGTVAVALLAALVVVVLAVRANGERQATRHLIEQRLLVVDAAHELRGAMLTMELNLAKLALWPADRRPLAAYEAAHAQAMAEARRARLNAHDPHTIDVVEEIENALLRFDAVAAEILTAARADRNDRVRLHLAEVERPAAELDALSEEFVTVAATEAEHAAHGIAGAGRLLLLLGLVVVAGVLALHAGALAARESGPALGALGAELLFLAKIRKQPAALPTPTAPPAPVSAPTALPPPAARDAAPPPAAPPERAEPPPDAAGVTTIEAPTEFAVVTAAPPGSDEQWEMKPIMRTMTVAAETAPATAVAEDGEDATPPAAIEDLLAAFDAATAAGEGEAFITIQPSDAPPADEAGADGAAEEGEAPTPTPIKPKAKPKRNPLFASAEEPEGDEEGSAA